VESTAFASEVLESWGDGIGDLETRMVGESENSIPLSLAIFETGMRSLDRGPGYKCASWVEAQPGDFIGDTGTDNAEVSIGIMDETVAGGDVKDGIKWGIDDGV
jgi:hypothetical protein